MKRVRYQVAASLDGYIAGPNGEADWIVEEPTFDFAALYAQFDTFLMGRATYEAMRVMGHPVGPGTYVFSRTLRPEDHPGVTVIAERAEEAVRELRAREGKDIWLFGGGHLFRSLAAAGLVDTVEVAVVPVMLGGGVPLLPAPAGRIRLTLTGHHVYPSGIALLEYAVAGA